MDPCRRHVSLRRSSYTVWKGGAAYVTRTRDPRITNARVASIKRAFRHSCRSETATVPYLGVRDPDMAALARASGVAEIAGDFSVYAGGEEMRPRPFRLADAQINGLAMGQGHGSCVSCSPLGRLVLVRDLFLIKIANRRSPSCLKRP